MGQTTVQKESLDHARQLLVGKFNEVAPHATALKGHEMDARSSLMDAWVSTRAFMIHNPDATPAQFAMRAKQSLSEVNEADDMSVLNGLLKIKGLEAAAEDRGITVKLPDTKKLQQRIGVTN